MARSFPQIRRLDGPGALRARLAELDCDLPVDDRVLPAGPLAEPLDHGGWQLANRLAVLPMEGWDATTDGRPTELLRRRWTRFGASGAGLVWGGEAVAVDPAGRANPHQLCIGATSEADLAGLRALLGDDQVVGLQLTDSGRWSRPEGVPTPRTAGRHPLLDGRVGAGADDVLSDTQLDDLVGAFVGAATVARQSGFDFVDVKHCHGYLLHELLAMPDRPGPYGGSFEGRTRFLRRVVEGIRRDAPGLGIGVRLSVFDLAPPDQLDRGEAYPYAFGGDGTGAGIDLTEPHRFCELLIDLGVQLLCVTAGSPYYVPHAQRPAYFPPSDGYPPPHDPLLDVTRLQQVARDLTRAHPQLLVVGSGLTYLQEYFGHVAQALVDRGWMHVAGYGRMALSLPSLAADLLAGEEPARGSICRTFSDCTTAPRHGLVSGCFPLDAHYRAMPERLELGRIKRAAKEPR